MAKTTPTSIPSPRYQGYGYESAPQAPLSGRALVIIPTYNEVDNVERIAREVSEAIACDILFVDDNSPDGTGRTLDTLAAASERVHVLHRQQRLGFAAAFVDSMRWALDRRYDLIIQMDSDFSHDPKHLQELAARAGEFELVIGSKYVSGGRVEGLAPWRKWLSRYGNLYARSVLWLKDRRFSIRDATSGYCCWQASLLRRVVSEPIRAEGYAFQIEMKWRAIRGGAAAVEVPICFVDRVAGRSKMSPSIILEALTLPLRLVRR
ncbi:MAG: polyprenol monophosphomannose synthase [Bdellovibrionales bacterium]|nr:polyprenol monophosphomannose synthase [Bdellovibrionales bacterium]